MLRRIGIAARDDERKHRLIRALVGDEVLAEREEMGKRKPLDMDLPPHGRALLVDLPTEPGALTTRRGVPVTADVALWVVPEEALGEAGPVEQLQRLDRLPVEALVVALACRDRRYVDTRRLEQLLFKGRFRGAPVVPFNYLTGDGVTELRRAMTNAIPYSAPSRDVLNDIVAQVAQRPQGCPTEEVARRLGVPLESLGDAFERLKSQGRLLSFAGQWWTPEAWQVTATRFLEALERLHEQYPSLHIVDTTGVVKEAGLKWSGKPLDRMLAHLVEDGRLVVQGNGVALPEFRVTLNERQVELLDRLIQAMGEETVDPPPVKDLARLLAVPIPAVETILMLGEQSGKLVRIAEDLRVPATAVVRVKQTLRQLGANGRPFTAGEFRDALETSRRVAIPWLEWADEQGFTDRREETRTLRRTPRS